MPLYKWLGPGQELDQDGQKYKPNDTIEMTEDAIVFMRKIGFLFEEVKREEPKGEPAGSFRMTSDGTKLPPGKPIGTQKAAPATKSSSR